MQGSFRSGIALGLCALLCGGYYVSTKGKPCCKELGCAEAVEWPLWPIDSIQAMGPLDLLNAVN